ncbi:unnamed protein product, partial [Amoebophrya sp. A25]
IVACSAGGGGSTSLPFVTPPCGSLGECPLSEGSDSENAGKRCFSVGSRPSCNGHMDGGSRTGRKNGRADSSNSAHRGAASSSAGGLGSSRQASTPRKRGPGGFGAPPMRTYMQNDDDGEGSSIASSSGHNRWGSSLADPWPAPSDFHNYGTEPSTPSGARPPSSWSHTG